MAGPYLGSTVGAGGAQNSDFIFATRGYRSEKRRSIGRQGGQMRVQEPEFDRLLEEPAHLQRARGG